MQVQKNIYALFSPSEKKEKKSLFGSKIKSVFGKKLQPNLKKVQKYHDRQLFCAIKISFKNTEIQTGLLSLFLTLKSCK